MSKEQRDWIQEVEKERQKIKDWACSDRLSILGKLTYLNSSLASSVSGWHSWFTNPLICAKFSEEELKALLLVFEKLTLDFLDLDISYSKQMRKIQAEEEKTQENAENKLTKEKIKYIK